MRKRSEATRRPRDEREIPDREYTIDVPNDPINEQVVLGAMLVADEETCDRLLNAAPTDAFYAKEHRVVREVIGEARRRKLALDPATLMRLNPEVDIRILEKLPEARPDVPVNIDFHLDTLQWDAKRAQIARHLASVLDAVQDPKESPERVKALARSVADAVEGGYGRSRFLRDPKEVVREAVDRLRRRAKGEAYYPYGIEGLDYYEDGRRRLRPGAAPGAMTLVTALSGSGKSTMMHALALAIAKQRRKVLFGSWEETAPVTIESLTVMALGWSRSRVLDGKSNRLADDAELTHEEIVEFEEKADKISQWIHIFDNPFQHDRARTARSLTNDDQLDIIQDHISQSGCEVFMPDLLARCLIDDSPSGEKRFLYRYLAIHEEEKIHSIAAHQQRAKSIEATPGEKRPTREGIIGAGAWLDVFWTVLAPHLPSKWKDVPDDTLELHVLKQRNGPWPLAIEFDWDGDTGQISGGRDIDVKGVVETSDEAFGLPRKGPGKGFHRAGRGRGRG